MDSPYEFDADEYSNGRFSCPVLDSSSQEGGGSWSCNEEAGDLVSGIFVRAFRGVRGSEDIRGKAGPLAQLISSLMKAP